MQQAPVRYRVKNTKLYVDPVVPRAKASASAYESASTSTRMSNWRINSGGPNNVMTGSLQTLRQRSRDIVRKNGLADNALEILTSNVVGTGIKPQFRTASPEFNKSLAKLWKRWTDEADAAGEWDFYGLQALAFRSMLEGGDVFTRLRPRRRGDVRTVPLQLQVLESEYCPVEKNETLMGLNIIQNGIQFDAIGRKVAYHMYRDHPDDLNLRQLGLGEPVPVPASEIVHMKQVRRPGMVRGEPWLVRAIVKMYDLDKYDDAQLLRQQLANMFAAFMSPSAEGRMPFETEQADSDGVIVSSLEPGTFQVLEPGADIKFSTPPGVGNDYAAFNLQQHHYIAASAGILYEQLTGDFSKVNDRTWRAAFNEFKRRIERLQHNVMVYQLCRPIMWRWAELGMVSGQISLPAGIEIDDVVDVNWMPQAWAYINPVQDVQAQREEVRAGFASRSAKVSERGLDVEDVDAQIASDNARALDLGIVLDTNPKETSRAGVTQARPGGSAFTDPDDEPEEPDDTEREERLAAARANEARALADLERARAEVARASAPAPVNNFAVHIPAPVLNVEVQSQPAPVVNVPAPIVNVPAPVVNIEAPKPVAAAKKRTKTTVTKRGANNLVEQFVQEEL